MPIGASEVSAAAIDVDKEFPIVRALYVNRFAAQSTKRMRQLIEIADSTEINALVIDMKDEFGLNFKPSNAEWAQNAGTAGDRSRTHGAARHAASARDPADRADRGVQGFGDGAGEPRLDDPPTGRLDLARQARDSRG